MRTRILSLNTWGLQNLRLEYDKKIFSLTDLKSGRIFEEGGDFDSRTIVVDLSDNARNNGQNLAIVKSSPENRKNPSVDIIDTTVNNINEVIEFLNLWITAKEEKNIDSRDSLEIYVPRNKESQMCRKIEQMASTVQVNTTVKRLANAFKAFKSITVQNESGESIKHPLKGKNKFDPRRHNPWEIILQGVRSQISKLR